jgi:hypothetical protein
MTDLKGLKKIIVKIAKEVSNSQTLKNILVAGGKDLEGRIKQRIFNKGQDSSGLPIGVYKAGGSWKKYREKSGRQVSYVDLEDKGNLRRSIQVVEEGPDVFLAIINDKEYLIAQGQEEQRQTTIFEPTKEEQKALQLYINDLIDEEIEKVLKNI